MYVVKINCKNHLLVELKYVHAKIKAFESRSGYRLKVGQAIFTTPVGQAVALPSVKIFKKVIVLCIRKIN